MKIEHIDQVLPHVRDRKDFVVAERDGYTVIDYVYQLDDTFAHPIRMECRGIKFGPDGRILARPLHKFYNVGEKPQTQPDVISFEAKHTITEKLDGSMVHPALLDGRVVFMTRMGRSDVAVKAERHLTPALEKELRRVLEEGSTPIFEFTAPDNRIVVRYPESGLTLLAVRNTVTGHYLSIANSMRLAALIGVDHAPTVRSDWSSTHDFLAFVRAITGKEGFVIRFDDGLWLKAKGDDYVLKHRSKDQIAQEKNALALILTDGADDVLPLLSDEDRTAFEAYRARVMDGIADTVARVESTVDSGARLDQKTFATEHLNGAPPEICALAFAVRAGKPAHEAVRDLILKNASTQARVDRVRHLFQAIYPH